jgi:DNA-binding Lrp family transcriptional regulator
MDIYHVWCDSKPGVSDLEFAEKIAAYMEHLKSNGLIEGWRLTRRKLGLAPAGLGDFHLMIEVRDMAQLDAAFQRVASRREPVETVHFAVNSLVDKAIFGLYRDFPDPVRQHGEERF